MEKKRFLDFLDMFDGGGAGQMGDQFEGGGLLSVLGNAFGSPYGSEDPDRRAARQAFYGSDQIGGAPMTSAPPPQQDNYTAPNYADRFGVPASAPPMQSGPPARALVGPQLRAAMNPTQVGILPAPALSFEQFVAGLGPVAQTASPQDLMTAYQQHMQGY